MKRTGEIADVIDKNETVDERTFVVNWTMRRRHEQRTDNLIMAMERRAVGGQRKRSIKPDYLHKMNSLIIYYQLIITQTRPPKTVAAALVHKIQIFCVLKG